MLSPIFCNLGRMTYGTRLKHALDVSEKSRASLAEHLDISVQAVGQVITGGRSRSQAFTAENSAKAAAFLGVSHYWLATGEGEMLEKDLFDADQTDATDGEAAGRAAMLEAVNILGTCLQRMDAESRKAASHFLQEMAASPTGGWSGRLVDLIEKYSPPELFEEIGIYVRAGNYSLSSRNHRPKIGSKSGNVQTAAIEKSNEPAGQDNASPSEDRNKDQNRGGDGAAGSS